MVVPDRSSRVKKWVVSSHLIRWGVVVVAFFVLIGIVTTLASLRYIARRGEFEQALVTNHYLEGQLQILQNRLSTADATIVRVQNLEQKLRSLANLDRLETSGGYGPISGAEEQILLKGAQSSGTLVASVEPREVPPEYGTKVRSLELTIDGLSNRASLQEQSLQELYELLKDQQSLLASQPSIWPTQGWVTSNFGYRISPFTGERQLHDGLDIASAQPGAKVVATADGVVTRTGSEEGYGKVVAVNHGYGIVTRYGHNSEILVKEGQRVKRGDPIALVGSTGRATGPHVHYEVRVNGVPVNPARYILN
jgi:murein DD-endopeptidase MepM/ murein hydrolase activator NlpD